MSEEGEQSVSFVHWEMVRACASSLLSGESTPSRYIHTSPRISSGMPWRENSLTWWMRQTGWRSASSELESVYLCYKTYLWEVYELLCVEKFEELGD